MAQTITLADITSKNICSAPLTESQTNFIRDNYNIMSYEEMKSESGIPVHTIVKMLKAWKVKKAHVIGRPKPPKKYSSIFNVNDNIDWIGL